MSLHLLPARRRAGRRRQPAARRSRVRHQLLQQPPRARAHERSGALIVEHDRDGDGDLERRWVCSGTMVDEDTFPTAAHCTERDGGEGANFSVSLEQVIDADALASAAQGTPVAHPSYPGSASSSYDIAVVEVHDPALLGEFTPALLPEAGLLDSLTAAELAAAEWVVAGCVTQEAVRGQGGQTHPGGGTRLEAPVTFAALDKTWVRLLMTAPQGNGGACYGDSGGPNSVTVDGVEHLVPTTITGDVPCYATNVTYRLDTAEVQEWLGRFLS